MQVRLFLNELELVWMYKVRWFQVLLFNTIHCILHSFVCTHLNDFKYCYLIILFNNYTILIICLHTIKSFKYCYLKQFYLTPIICLHQVKWFEELLFNIIYSIFKVFLCNTKIFLTAIWFQIIIIIITIIINKKAV